MTGVMIRRDRVLIRMFGRDPLKMIQGLASNDIAGAAVGQSVYTTFLTPKGKMVGDARVLRRENGEVWIEADVAAADNIVANLRKFVPPLFARFEPMPERRVLEIIGERRFGLANGIAHEAVLTNPFRSDSIALVINAEDAALSSALNRGAEEISDDLLEIKRVEAGEPKWGHELTEDVIPLEAGLRHVAISETKGCYTGQEVIVRILHRGHVNRQLRGIMTGSQEVPALNSELVRAEDGKVVGNVTSAVFSPALDQAIALGYLRREIEPPAVLQLNGNEVQVIELPFAVAAQGAQP